MTSESCGKCGYAGISERRTAKCAGCGRKTMLCTGCWATYVVCSEACREAWREEAKVTLTEPLSPTGKPKDPKPDDPQRRLW